MLLRHFSWPLMSLSSNSNLVSWIISFLWLSSTIQVYKYFSSDEDFEITWKRNHATLLTNENVRNWQITFYSFFNSANSGSKFWKSTKMSFLFRFRYEATIFWILTENILIKCLIKYLSSLNLLTKISGIQGGTTRQHTCIYYQLWTWFPQFQTISSLFIKFHWEI